MVRRVETLPEVLFLGSFSFPKGDAVAKNFRGHALALRCAGFSVGFLLDQLYGREEDRQPDGSYDYRGVPYWPVRRSFRTRPRPSRTYLRLCRQAIGVQLFWVRDH